MSPLALTISATTGLCAIFGVSYVFARRIDNFGIVDVAWSYAFAVIGLFYASFADGWPARRVLFSALVVIWSVRLGTHLGRRVAGHHPVEDGRYVQLRKDWAKGFAL